MPFNPLLIWFIAGLALVLAEFMVPGVILVFFGVGAWITALTSWLGWTDGWTSQLMTFAISSIVLLVVLRRRFRSRFFGYVGNTQNPDENMDEFTGKSVKVIADIAPGDDTGRVEFKGASWKATSDTPIITGALAVIVSVDGINLKVRPEQPGT
ncbi:MAG: NfeD family protein [Gemmatimonadales bacterium]|nr:NfeD family protein [Gemmatimonadales bacterium]